MSTLKNKLVSKEALETLIRLIKEGDEATLQAAAAALVSVTEQLNDKLATLETKTFQAIDKTEQDEFDRNLDLYQLLAGKLTTVHPDNLKVKKAYEKFHNELEFLTGKVYNDYENNLIDYLKSQKTAVAKNTSDVAELSVKVAEGSINIVKEGDLVKFVRKSDGVVLYTLDKNELVRDGFLKTTTTFTIDRGAPGTKIYTNLDGAEVVKLKDIFPALAGDPYENQEIGNLPEDGKYITLLFQITEGTTKKYEVQFIRFDIQEYTAAEITSLWASVTV